MIELGIKIFVLVVLLRLNGRLSSDMPFWHKGLIFSVFCILLQASDVFGLIDGTGFFASGYLFPVLYCLKALLLPSAYFYGVDHLPGRLNLPFLLVGGAALVYLL